MEATKIITNKRAGRVRTVARVVDSIETLEGGGFLVRRPFPQAAISEFDPFLLLDEMGPMDVAPGEAKGAPDHPHRGFETVTYMLAGEFEHKDSLGHAGKLGPGDVQWMTAGAGVVHSEMPSERIQREGGLMHGFQLWVNLPRKDKMMKPRYQEISSANIPKAQTEDELVTVRVIAGESLGARAVIDTITPITYLHFTLRPGGRVAQPVLENYNAFVYIVDGNGEFGAAAEQAKNGQMVIFGVDGDEIAIANPSDSATDLNVLLLAGLPLNEPISRYGPFVMNTRAEIYQAVEDYQNGRMGEIDF
jgi:redox-sensitive bicupin YhaK (pirin superfamily)